MTRYQTIQTTTMMSFFKKDPIKKLNQEYQSILEKAMQAQRKGDIKLYSELTDNASFVLKKIEEYQ